MLATIKVSGMDTAVAKRSAPHCYVEQLAPADRAGRCNDAREIIGPLRRPELQGMHMRCMTHVTESRISKNL